jgi:hypothetical protein
MSQKQVSTDGRRGRDLPDYLKLVGQAMYALTGVLFVGGLWFDWQSPGVAIIPVFSLADEPNANSGLFIAGVIILVLGYLLSKAGEKVRAYRAEKVDQTQEWEVDID